ncbi:MAG: helix-turn-helix transcriptional regulator [Bacilli bacterium]|nr:helix-turn-helix transcriptional regulator [Bacilli bacterium]
MIVANLRNSRLVLGLTQKDVAKDLNVDDSTVSGWECGKDTIPMERIIQYARTYNFSLDYLFGLTDKREKIMDIALDLELIAMNLKTLRKEKNITQKDVATIINTSQSAYSQYEKANILINTSFLYNLVTYYKIESIDEFLTKPIEK